MSSFLIRGHNTYPTGHYLKMAETDFSCIKYYWINMCLPSCNDNNWHLFYPVFKILFFSISECGGKQKTVCLLISVVWFAALFPFPTPPPINFLLKQLSYARSPISGWVLNADSQVVMTGWHYWQGCAHVCVGTLTTKRHLLAPDFLVLISSIFWLLKVLGGE